MTLRGDWEVDRAGIAGAHPPVARALEERDVARAVRLISDPAEALADIDRGTIAQYAE
jgi:hypothetical protein